MDGDRVTRLARALKAAEAPVRILRGLEWPASARDTFLRHRGDRLPDVLYAPFDPGPTLSRLDGIRAELRPQGDPVDAWLGRIADRVASGARPEQAFENARRVFRGGVLTGGAPFTKDIVYLDGLLRVQTFLSHVVASGRSDCLRLLFAGKLDIEDVPALAMLTRAGLCRLPRHLSPWAEGLRYLIGYLAWSSFLGSVDMERVGAHYDGLLAAAPRLDGVEGSV